MTLRAAPPRPTAIRVAPAYPRLLALGALLVAGCGGVVDKDAPKADPNSVTAQKPADGGGEVDPTIPEPISAGGAPYPYEPDAAETDPPPPPPPPPPPVEAGPSETDPPSAGGEPFPFDDAGAPDAEDPAAPNDAGPAPSP